MYARTDGSARANFRLAWRYQAPEAGLISWPYIHSVNQKRAKRHMVSALARARSRLPLSYLHARIFLVLFNDTSGFEVGCSWRSENKPAWNHWVSESRGDLLLAVLEPKQTLANCWKETLGLARGGVALAEITAWQLRNSPGTVANSTQRVLEAAAVWHSLLGYGYPTLG